MDKKTLFPDKYIAQAFGLIKIRWFAFVFAIVANTAGYLFHFPGPQYTGLYSAAILLLAMNAAFYFNLLKVSKKCQIDNNCERLAKLNINFQIVFDFIILAVMLHFSGGIENPAIVFFIFHMILSGIYLTPRNAYSIATLAVSLFLALVISEYFGIIDHHSINNYISAMITHEPLYLFGSLALFILTSFIAVFIAVSLSEELRNTKKLLTESNKLLLEKDKIKDEFIQRVTHDIKGGLAVTQSCLTVVEKQILGPMSTQNADFVDKALNRSKKLSSFVNELLTLTKMRLANRFDTTRLSIGDIIKNVVTSIQSDAEKKNIKVSLDIQDELLFMNGISVSIEEALTNLAHNAVKYTPPSGKVDITIKKKSEKIIIEIKDTGYGIPEKDIPNIFKDFFRAGNTTNIEGTGLGLSLVKAIVERHNGSISFTSKENSGTTFTVIFDAVD